MVDASVKPLIGFLWLGTILLGLGTAIAFVRRTIEGRATAPTKRKTAA